MKPLIYEDENHLRNVLKKFKCDNDIIEILVELFNNHVENNNELTSQFKSITFSICKNTENKENWMKRLRLMWNNYNEFGELDLEILRGDLIEVERKYERRRIGKDSYYVELSDEYNPPNSQGVYFLYNENKELEYIGKSNNLYSRIQSSTRERDTLYARYIKMKTLADTHIMELYFIGKYKPIKNSDSKAVDEITFEIKDYTEDDMSEYFRVFNIIGKVKDFESPPTKKVRIYEYLDDKFD